FWPTDSTASLSAATAWILLLLIGIFTLCYGTRAVRTALFPILFLILMVPIPEPVLNSVAVLLQRASCETTYLLMTLGGAPVLRNGFVLSLQAGSIEVAKECSGIRSTLGLLIGSLVASHLFLRSPWKKALFASSVVPVSIFKNALRIVCLYWLGFHTDKRFLTGQLHRHGGIPFSLVALGILGPVLWILRRSEARPTGKGLGTKLHRVTSDSELPSLS
ncbi:MAG: exosortase/archaeosortase family protein, partial [Terriglobia bacterium]